MSTTDVKKTLDREVSIKDCSRREKQHKLRKIGNFAERMPIIIQQASKFHLGLWIEPRWGTVQSGIENNKDLAHPFHSPNLTSDLAITTKRDLDASSFDTIALCDIIISRVSR